MSFYCRDDDWSDDENDVEFDSMHKHEEYSHSEMIHQCNFGFRHLINARLSSKASLQYQADSITHETTPHCLNSNDIDNDYGTDVTIKSFPTMLKLISGTLVGGVKYSDLYIDSNEGEDTSSTTVMLQIVTKAMTRTTINIKYQHYQKKHKKGQSLRRHNWMKNNILHMK
jgi:hypothetical protein